MYFYFGFQTEQNISVYKENKQLNIPQSFRGGPSVCRVFGFSFQIRPRQPTSDLNSSIKKLCLNPQTLIPLWNKFDTCTKLNMTLAGT